MKKPDRRRSAARRWLFWSVVALGLLVVGIFVGLELLIKQPSVERAIIARLQDEVAEQTGLQLQLGEIQVSILRASAQVENFRLGSPGTDPLVAADRVDVALELTSLWSDPLTLRRLLISDLRVDLDQPLPAVAGDREGPGSEIALAIEYFEIDGGRIDGPVVPIQLTEWIERWWMEDVGIRGRWGVEEIELALEAIGRWSRQDGGKVEIAAQGMIEGAPKGPWRVSELTLSGDGLEGRMSGVAGLHHDDPMEARFDLTLDPQALVPVPAATEPVEIRGEVDLRQRRGSLSLYAMGLPGELASPWLEEDNERPVDLSGWRVDADIDVAVTGTEQGPSGSGHLRAVHDEIVWLDGGFELSTDAEASGLPIEIELTLLPDAEGRRTAGGVLVADLDRYDASEIRSGRLEIVDTELDTLLEAARTLDPELLQSQFPAALTGTIEATGTFGGPIYQIRTDLEGILSRDGSRVAVLRAEGTPQESKLDAEVDIEQLELVQVDPSLSGEVSGRATARLRPESTNWGARLEGSGISTEKAATTLDELSVEFIGSDREIVVESLRGRLNDRPFEGSGSLELSRPISRATFDLAVQEPVEGLRRLDLSLTLANGRIEVRARPETENEIISEIEATIPWRSLTRVPALSKALSELPIEGADGPVRLSWRVPEAEWSDTVEALIGRSSPLDSLQLGLRGELEFDPARPLAAEGELVIDGLRLTGGETEVAAVRPVRLRLEDRRVVLEPVEVVAEKGSAELEVWAALAENWQPGDAMSTLVERFEVEASSVVPLSLLKELDPETGASGNLELALSAAGTATDLSGEMRLYGPEAEWIVDVVDGLTLSRPELEIRFAGDRLHIERARVGIDDAEFLASGEIPVATLWALASKDLAASRAELDPIEFAWELPVADWSATLRRFGLEESLEVARLGAVGELKLDPSRPLDAEGRIELSEIEVQIGDRVVRMEESVRVELADARIELRDLRMTTEGQPFELGGTIVLDADWQTGRPLSELVETLDFEAQGTMVADLLNPFLAGGAAEGLLQVDVDVEGSPRAPEGRIVLAGPQASILFVSPYVAKIEALELELELVDGRARIREGRLQLNDGEVVLGGSLGLEGVDLTAALDGLRFRLDYGLLARIDGDLELTADAEGRGLLSGRLIVDQASLTRPISIDRDFISQLLSPVELIGTESTPLDQIDLDLDLETRRGARIRNNVADLAVQWDRVEVRGTLAAPVIDGRFEIEPGGRVFLFGQTLRVDRGVVSFPGLPGAAATLDLETTSSLDDPAISRLRGDDALALSQQEPAEDLEARAREAGWATAAFVSEQVATRIAEAVPAARLTFRPILIFGEADPGARLTIGRDFSRYVTLAASIDLRNAERQTFILDAHDLPRLPGVVLQIFTDDEQQEGATLQHRTRFGSFRRTMPTGPRLRRLEIEPVPGISARKLRRAAILRKGDRASIDDLFLAEVEIGEFLRRSGYPDARVTVESQPVSDRPQRVDVQVSIEAGPSVRFDFEGESIPGSLRRSITSLYRSDFYEPVAIEEMRAQTVRALRSLGYLEPTVEIEVEVETGSGEPSPRTVLIRSEGGVQLPLETLRVEGLPADEAEQVASTFATDLQRMELAAGETTAERRLLAAVQALGYPAAEIVGTGVSLDRHELIIAIEPGPVRHVQAVRVEGVGPELANELRDTIAIEAGDPARRDRIASGALVVESELQARGYADARATPRVVGAQEASGGPVQLIYDVDPGMSYTVGETRISGLRSTSKRWATSIAEMESGAPLRESEVAAARSRLYDTGLFTMVGTDSFVTEGGRTEVVFDVEERPRYSVAYGLRWDDDDGTQGVIDLVDGNFLGRSVTLGLRGLYKQDDWSVRLGAGVPRLFGTRAVLEIFGSYRDTFDEMIGEFTASTFDEQTIETSIQVAYPFGRHVFGRVYGRYRTANLLVVEIDQDPIFPLPPTSLEFDFKTPLLGTLWTYDSRDRELVLTRGIFASLDLSGTGGFLGSDFEYIRMFGQINIYKPIGRWAGRGLSWAQSYRLGLAESFDQELDRNDRFFAGGQYSVRGYPTESLGPVEMLGDQSFPLGGKTLLVLNQELRFDLLGPVAGVAFFDLGNVWEDTAEIDSELFKSLGVGLRADTPVGLLRLDWAFPLDRREGDPSSKLYFGFGNTF